MKRSSLLSALFCLLPACGQIAEEPAAPPTSSSSVSPPSSGSSSGEPASTSAPSGTTADDNAYARQPMPVLCSGASSIARTYGSTSEVEVAILGLWETCAGASMATLCPAQDYIVLLGSLDQQHDTTSRALTCGTLTSHGDAMIADTNATFTFEVKELASGDYVLHAWNANVDRTLALAYFGSLANDIYDDALSLTSTSESGAIHRTAFTTF